MFWLAACLLFTTATPPKAESPRPGNLGRLVKQLGSTSFAERVRRLAAR
jgi:hypothetical protein